MRAHTFNCAHKFPQMGFLILIFCILGRKIFDNNKLFRQFSDSQKFTWGGATVSHKFWTVGKLSENFVIVTFADRLRDISWKYVNVVTTKHSRIIAR